MRLSLASTCTREAGCLAQAATFAPWIPLPRPATLADAPALTDLINRAYRGPATPQSWTTESQLFDGPRIDQSEVVRMVTAAAQGRAALHKYVGTDGLPVGCVWLQIKDQCLYLSTLAVAPETQAQGVGRQLLAHAEDYARAHGCARIVMSVLSARPELLAWYERHGYQRTGGSAPFPATVAFGQPRQPLTLLELARNIG